MSGAMWFGCGVIFTLVAIFLLFRTPRRASLCDATELRGHCDHGFPYHIYCPECHKAAGFGEHRALPRNACDCGHPDCSPQARDIENEHRYCG